MINVSMRPFLIFIPFHPSQQSSTKKPFTFALNQEKMIEQTLVGFG